MYLLRKLSLAITLIGILVLFVLLNLSSPKIVSSPQELNGLTDNSLVQTTGKVISERTLYEKTKLFVLDSKIELICNSCPSYANKTIQITGTTEKYENKTQIRALRIKNK